MVYFRTMRLLFLSIKRIPADELPDNTCGRSSRKPKPRKN